MQVAAGIDRAEGRVGGRWWGRRRQQGTGAGGWGGNELFRERAPMGEPAGPEDSPDPGGGGGGPSRKRVELSDERLLSMLEKVATHRTFFKCLSVKNSSSP